MLALSLFFFPFLFIFLFALRPGTLGVNLLVRWGAGSFIWLAVRLPCSRPKVGGYAWLVVRACGLVSAVDLFHRWLFISVSLLFLSSCLLSELIC